MNKEEEIKKIGFFSWIKEFFGLKEEIKSLNVKIDDIANDFISAKSENSRLKEDLFELKEDNKKLIEKLRETNDRLN